MCVALVCLSACWKCELCLVFNEVVAFLVLFVYPCCCVSCFAVFPILLLHGCLIICSFVCSAQEGCCLSPEWGPALVMWWVFPLGTILYRFVCALAMVLCCRSVL